MPDAAACAPVTDDRLSWNLCLGVTAATVVGGAVANATPFMLDAAMRQTGASASHAARLLSAEQAVFFLAAILAPRFKQFPSAGLVALACLIFAAGNGLALMTQSVQMLLLFRLLCGFAAGCAFSGAIQITASQFRFDRLFAISIVGATFVAALSLFAVGELLEDGSGGAVYGFYAGIGLIAAPLCLALRTGGRTEAASHISIVAPVTGVLILVFLLSRLSDAAFWSFSERFGARAGLGTAEVGFILGISVVVALGAPLLAILVKRAGAVIILFTAALGIKSLMPIMVFYVPGRTEFITAQLVASFCFVLLTQLLLSRFAALDATGRLGTVGGLAGLAGEGVGPVVAGEAYRIAGFGGVANVAMLSGLIAAGLFVAISTHAAVRRIQ
jgi:MFS family permease